MEMSQVFLDMLEMLRVMYAKPIIITSGYRCPKHNQQVSGSGFDGPHTIGAADIAVSGSEAYDLLRAASLVGFSGIGIRQSGPHASRFIHLDNCTIPGTAIPRPRIWSY